MSIGITHWGVRVLAGSQNRGNGFGELVGAAMRLKQLDYRSLASTVGVSHAYLWQLVSADEKPETAGKRRKRPSQELVMRLADVLELDCDGLLQAAGYHDAPPAPGITHFSTFKPDGRALYEKGLEETRRGHPERGLVLLKQAASAEGVPFARVHMALGVSYLNTRNFESAIAEFEKVLDLLITGQEARDGIDLADVYYDLGLAFQDRGQHSKAVANFRLAIGSGSDNIDRYFAALAFSELALGRYRRVIATALSFLDAESQSSHYTTAALDVRLYQAYAYCLLGQYCPAVALAEATVALCPRYWYSHYVSAAILARYAGYLAERKTRAREKEPRVVAAALRRCRQALNLNPKGIADFRAELEGDFKALKGLPEFNALLVGQEQRHEG